MTGTRRWPVTLVTRLPLVVCVLCLVLVLAAVNLAILNGRSLAAIVFGEIVLTIAILATAFAIAGAIVASHRPVNATGWLLCAAAICQALIIFGEEYAAYTLVTHPGTLPGGPEMAWLKEWIWAPGLGLILVFVPLLFPDGRLLSHHWRWVGWLGAVSIALISVPYMVSLWPERGVALVVPGGEAESTIAPAIVKVTDLVGLPMMLVAALAALISQVVRFRRASRAERQQIKWIAFATALSLAFAVAFEGISSSGNNVLHNALVVLSFAIVPSIPASIVIAMLRYRLYNIDHIINRTLVYVTLTMSILGLYVAIVSYTGALLESDGDLLIPVVATGGVAMIFAPLRNRLQIGVNRLMYGERDNPYTVLSRLDQHLKTTNAPDAVLRAIVDTAAEALKLPYAMIEVRTNDEPQVIAVHGTPDPGPPVTVPLTYGTETIGRFVISPRAPGEPFNPADRRLLDDLARHAASAAYAFLLTTDLQHSRERLVNAREEERRRLRRDLHDGLGPQLATLALKLDTARNLLVREPQAAETIMKDLKGQAQAAIADIRRLVYNLRPPALDELGLVSAIREQAATFSQAGVQVSVEAPHAMPVLPAAIEVAAYRIVQEALTNVVRHAGATRCRVTLTLGSALEITVLDDGTGLPDDRRTGVGLSSMHERTAELGGSCIVERAGSTGGTCVRARIPLSSTVMP